MSWLTDTLPGIATTVAGGVLDVVPGTQAIGIPLTAAGLAMLGQEDTNFQNKKLASDAQDFNAQQAQQQMAFQAQMSNTAYQRTVADMTAAGVNPMMAINNGGASSPSGSSGSGINATMQNAIGQGVNSAVAVGSLQNAMKGTDSNVALNKALSAKAVADANTSGMTAKNLELRSEALSSQLGAIAARANADQKTAGYDAAAAKYDAIANRANRESGTAQNVGSLFKIFGAKGQMLNPQKEKWTSQSERDAADRQQLIDNANSIFKQP